MSSTIISDWLRAAKRVTSLLNPFSSHISASHVKSRSLCSYFLCLILILVQQYRGTPVVTTTTFDATCNTHNQNGTSWFHRMNRSILGLPRRSIFQHPFLDVKEAQRQDTADSCVNKPTHLQAAVAVRRISDTQRHHHDPTAHGPSCSLGEYAANEAREHGEPDN